MTDTSSPNPAPSAPTAPGNASSGAPRLEGGSVFLVQINFLAFCLAILLTIVGVKLSSYLPDVIYFSFSRAIETSKKPSPFFIQPPHLTRDQVCKAIENKPEFRTLRCDYVPEETPEQQPPATIQQTQQEEQLHNEVDRYIREQAQKTNIFHGIFGLLIRLAIPCLAGFLAVRVFGAEQVTAAGLGAGAGALLLCWPVIVLWDFVVTKDWREFYTQFLALYALYIIIFFYLGRIGGLLGAALRGPNFTLNYGKIIESVTISALGAVILKLIEGFLIVPKA